MVYVGLMGNIHFLEIADFFLGWSTLDLCRDDRAAQPAPEKKAAPEPPPAIPADPPAALPRRPTVARLASFVTGPRQGLLLSGRTEKPCYKPDEPIVVEVRLENATQPDGAEGGEPRDLAVYYEPFAVTPEGETVEWLFRFFVFDVSSGRVHYRSPRFDVPDDARRNYSHYVTLAPGDCVGRPFRFPAPNVRNWLPPGDYALLATYEISEESPYLPFSPGLTDEQIKKLGDAVAYVKVWAGRLCSNVVLFRVERK